MVSASAAAEKSILWIAQSCHEPRQVELARRVIGELASAVGSSGDPESAIADFYRTRAHSEPYRRPSGGRDRRVARFVMIFRDVLGGREPRRKYLFEKQPTRPAPYAGALASYEGWLRSEGMSSATVRTRSQRASVLLAYLDERGIRSLGELDAEALAGFVGWLPGRYAAQGKSNILYGLRSFFRCPSVLAELSFDPSGLLCGIRTPKHERLPSVYSAEEVSALLSSIDRETDAGRMLHLAVTLAAVYGLRASDIRSLRIDDVDFKAKTIRVVQHKTGVPIELPLVECAELSLLDYLMRTRRDCGHREVLIKSRGRAEPYSDDNHFGAKVSAAMERAGIVPGGRKAGLHALRHSLATGMMASGFPVTDIASVLGHSSAQATKAYVWSDIERLRVAALEVA